MVDKRQGVIDKRKRKKMVDKKEKVSDKKR